MKLWIDDCRKPPDHDWVWVKTAEQALNCIFMSSMNGETLEEISFDHDLGEGAGTGYDVAKYLEEMAYVGGPNVFPQKWAIHSANPVGSENIRKAMEKAEEYWLRWYPKP